MTDQTSTKSPVAWIGITLLLSSILPASGCRICTSSEDLAYPSYGGAWQRTIRDSGRVGSIFDPAGGRASELVNRDDPITADEIERNRRDAESTDDDDPAIDEDDPGQSRDSSDEPDVDDSSDGESDSGDDDADLEELKKKLREQKLDEVKIIPGDPLPPLLR